MPGCGTREYRNISKMNIDKMLAYAVSQGAVISGVNPWNIQTGLHGIILEGKWNKDSTSLSVSVVDVNWYVPCKTVWGNIDAMLSNPVEQKNNMEGAMDIG